MLPTQTAPRRVCTNPGDRRQTRNVSVIAKLLLTAVAAATLAGCNPEPAIKVASTVGKDSAALQRMARGLQAADRTLLLDAGRLTGRATGPTLNAEVKLPTAGWHIKDEAPFTSGCSVSGAAAGWKTDPETGLLTFGGCRGGLELARRHVGQ